MPTPQHILVIRFSSMGDVAMIVPVIKNVLQQNPLLKVTVVSNEIFQPLFNGLERCSFHPAFLKKQHKGAVGLFRLYQQINSVNKITAIADLHSVLRSHLLTTFFRLSGIKTAVLVKGRPQKKQLTRKKDKICRQLTTMHERYAAVFRKFGLPLQLEKSTPIFNTQPVPPALQAIFSSGKKVIGVAPFAQYIEKMYPIAKMKTVVAQLAAANNTVLLFGGPYESAILQQWEQDIFSVFNIAGKYAFKDELAIISNLDVMVSMDSANMHLASLFKVRVVSIWGATHPFAGFYGWAQDKSNIVEIDLYCRPCSVFGNKPCYRGDHACMKWISEDLIVKKTIDMPIAEI